MYGYIHLIALDCLLFFFLFDGLPGLTVWRPAAGVWIISTGIPGDERGVQGS